MLGFLGLSELDQLFELIPAAVRLAGGLDLPEGRSEPDVAAQFARYTAANRATSALTCYAGAGAYDHEVPAVVRALASRSEFVTAYTPYQPEVAQGVLQAVFEFQTMVSRLSGLAIANASLYDGATSLVEALNMAHGATGRSKMVISAGVHPHWRAVVATFARGTGHEIVEVGLRDGVTDWASVDVTDAAAVVGAYPNYLGVLEDLSVARRAADTAGALLVVAADPVAAGVLRPAAYWGADVCVGEGQPFGTALGFGGPYLGPLRLHPRAGASPAGSHRRRDRRLQRSPRVRHDAARSRAGHPSREGDVERLHQSDLDGGDGGGPVGLAGHVRPARGGDPLPPRARTISRSDCARFPV